MSRCVTLVRDSCVTYPDWVGESQRDSQRETFRYSDHQDRHTNDEEFDEILDIVGGPGQTFQHVRLDTETYRQNDHG